MSRPMPVKLSGELAEETRQAGDARWPLLEKSDGTLKIIQGAGLDQRKKLMAVLDEFLNRAPALADHSWLSQLSAKGIPLYGTKAGKAGLIRRDRDGKETPMSAKAARKTTAAEARARSL